MACIVLDEVGEPTTFFIISLYSIAYVAAYVALIVQTAIVTGSDPSDPTVRLERLHRESKEAFEQKESSHIVDFHPEHFSFFCGVCNAHVLPNSKHC